MKAMLPEVDGGGWWWPGNLEGDAVAIAI